MGVGQVLDGCWAGAGWVLGRCWMGVGQVLDGCWAGVGWVLDGCRASVGWVLFSCATARKQLTIISDQCSLVMTYLDYYHQASALETLGLNQIALQNSFYPCAIAAL